MPPATPPGSPVATAGTSRSHSLVMCPRSAYRRRWRRCACRPVVARRCGWRSSAGHVRQGTLRHPLGRTGRRRVRLRHLAGGLRRSLRRARLPVDPKPLRPHLTISRSGERVAWEQVTRDVETLASYAGPGVDGGRPAPHGERDRAHRNAAQNLDTRRSPPHPLGAHDNNGPCQLLGVLGGRGAAEEHVVPARPALDRPIAGRRVGCRASRSKHREGGHGRGVHCRLALVFEEGARATSARHLAARRGRGNRRQRCGVRLETAG